jgi:hypothetical protein
LFFLPLIYFCPDIYYFFPFELTLNLLCSFSSSLQCEVRFFLKLFIFSHFLDIGIYPYKLPF